MKNLIKGKTGDWEMVIGLEVHAQVISNSKLFSGAPATYGAAPNENVSLVDAALPGMLPVLNAECVKQAIRSGYGLNAKINTTSVFERKNYFYADLPQGYQISQFEQPIVGEGYVIIDLPNGESKRIEVERLHLEQDAGKSIHDQHPTKTYVDLNRSGVALMEIVSKPDIRSGEEAAAYVKKLRQILRYLGTCDGNMDEGSMRADVNLSMRRPGEPYGTRCEIKNMNSVRFMLQAIEYEAQRQIEILEEGGRISQETRLWDTKNMETRPLRSKEEAHDYRYFPDPDLLPLVLTQDFIDEVQSDLPELPDAKKERFVKELGLSVYDADVLISERDRADFFEQVTKGRDGKARDGKLSANWLITELLGALNKAGKELHESPVSADALGGLVDLISDNTISGKIAKDVFAEMLASGRDATIIVEEKGLRQVTDTGAIETIVDKVIAANPDKVAEFKSGKDKLFGFFVGQVLKESQGKANPQMVNDLLLKKLAI